MSGPLRRRPFHGPEKTAVLRTRSHRHTEGEGEAKGTHRTHEDVFPEQAPGQRLGIGLWVVEEEVRDARRRGYAEPPEASCKKSQLFEIVTVRTRGMAAIAECGERRFLRDDRDTVGRPRSGDLARDLRIGE